MNVRCPFCRSNVMTSGAQPMVKCSSCGESFRRPAQAAAVDRKPASSGVPMQAIVLGAAAIGLIILLVVVSTQSSSGGGRSDRSDDRSDAIANSVAPTPAPIASPPAPKPELIRGASASVSSRRVDRAQLDQLITITGGVYDFTTNVPGRPSFSVQQRAQLVVADKLWNVADVFCTYPPSVNSSSQIDFSDITGKSSGRLTLNFRSETSGAFKVSVRSTTAGELLDATIAGDVWKHIEIPFDRTQLYVYVEPANGKVPFCFVSYSLDDLNPSATTLIAQNSIPLPGDWASADELQQANQERIAAARRSAREKAAVAARDSGSSRDRGTASPSGGSSVREPTKQREICRVCEGTGRDADAERRENARLAGIDISTGAGLAGVQRHPAAVIACRWCGGRGYLEY